MREVYPGDRTKEITTSYQKIVNSKSTTILYNKKQTVLMDTVSNVAHKLYEIIPNMTYVINTDGIVIFRAN